MNRINIAIVDDNQEFIQSMINYLGCSKDIFVISNGTTKEQAVKLPEIYDIDIMLIDINLSENKCDGILLANQISSKYVQKPKLIMLTDYNDKELIQKSFLAGATYYVLKTDFKLLPDIIRSIYNNSFPVETVLRDYSDLMKDNILKSQFRLSDAETKIYNLVELGNAKSKIIGKLHISESTYKKHVNSILKKIEATSIKKAIAKFKETFFVKDIDKNVKG